MPLLRQRLHALRDVAELGRLAAGRVHVANLLQARNQFQNVRDGQIRAVLRQTQNALFFGPVVRGALRGRQFQDEFIDLLGRQVAQHVLFFAAQLHGA